MTGLILAGGAGRRMGGADKGLLDWHGRPLVAHVVERLAPQVATIIVSANRNLETYRQFGHPVVRDDLDDFAGPLAGLAAGLEACTTDWLVCVPCDCPALPLDLAARLLAAARSGSAAMAVAATSDGMQPTFQLLHRKLLPDLRAYLSSGERRVGGWCRRQQATTVVFDDAAAFANFNTPDTLI